MSESTILPGKNILLTHSPPSSVVSVAFVSMVVQVRCMDAYLHFNSVGFVLCNQMDHHVVCVF